MLRGGSFIGRGAGIDGVGAGAEWRWRAFGMRDIDGKGSIWVGILWCGAAWLDIRGSSCCTYTTA